MKINVTNTLIGILIAVLLFQNFGGFDKITPEARVEVMPEVIGTTGQQYVEPKIVVVQVPSGDKTIEVDSYWKRKYEEATQRDKDSLYNEAIKINNYKDTIVNDDRVLIEAEARTRGSLLDFKVDYKLKEHAFNYDPEVIVKRPSLQVEYGAGIYLGNEDIYTPIELTVREGKYGIGIRGQYDPITKTKGLFINKTFTLIK